MPKLRCNRAEKLKRLIKRHVNAQVASSWKGHEVDSEAIDAIEQEAKDAKRELFKFLNNIVGIDFYIGD